MPFIFNGLKVKDIFNFKIGAFMKNRIKSYEMQEKWLLLILKFINLFY